MFGKRDAYLFPKQVNSVFLLVNFYSFSSFKTTVFLLSCGVPKQGNCVSCCKYQSLTTN